MCLIIFTPNIKHATIRRNVLERGFWRNDDGAGMAYVRAGQLVISKPFMTFDAFHSAYQRALSTMDRQSALLIHFRRGTCGPNNATNTQPLSVYGGQLVMAHNGVFGHLSDHKSEISDSVALSRMIRRVGWTFPFKKACVEMLDMLCDRSSKLVFLSNRGQYKIINEQLGKWRGGCWYSDGASVCESGAKRSSVWDDRMRSAYDEGYGPDHPDRPGYRYNTPGEYNDEGTTQRPVQTNHPFGEKHPFGAKVVKPAGAILKSKRTDFPRRPDIPTGMPRYMMNADQCIAYDKWMSFQKNILGVSDPEAAYKAARGFSQRSLVVNDHVDAFGAIDHPGD